jgi:hypothetical protein
MTLSNNSNPSEDDRRSAETGKNDDSLQFPAAPRASYNRMLVDAYLDNCKRGFLERNELITSFSDMEYEDRVALQAMESAYRQIFHSKMQEFGFGDVEKDLTLRLLHPVVSIGKTRREYHLYVDIVSAQGRCWFLDFDAAGRLEKGPASIQLSSLGPQAKNNACVITRLFSLPAFDEALAQLVATPFDQVQKKPRDFIAFGWVMQAIAMARGGHDGRGVSNSSRPPKPIPLSSVEDFTWTGERRPFTFECSIENAYYVAQVTLSSRTKQPQVYLHEEIF